VRQRHARHVAAVAHAVRLWKFGPAPAQRAALLALAQEIRPAVAWARDHDEPLHVALCASLGSYWVYRGVISEATEELRRARESTAGSAVDRAWVTSRLAKCVQLSTSPAEAALLADEGL